jgi:hypothetical protein
MLEKNGHTNLLKHFDEVDLFLSLLIVQKRRHTPLSLGEISCANFKQA